MRILFLLFFFVFSFQFLYCQKKEKAVREDFSYKHTVTLSVGRATRLDEHDNYIPKAIGADYLYRLKPKWEIGAQFDLSFNDANNQPDLFIVVGIGAYSITSKWPVFVGFGLENRLEGKGVKGLFRVGSEYTFFLDKKEHFAVLPGAFVDVTYHGVSPAFILAFGYFFGN